MSANAWTEKGRECFAAADIDWDADTIKVMAADLTTTDVAVKAITGTTNASPIVITANSHGFSNGDIVVVGGVGGNTAANAKWTVANVATNTFELSGSTGNGAYTSGGWVANLTLGDNIDDVSAGRLGTDQTLSTKTNTYGVLDADDISFAGISSGTLHGFWMYKSTGNETTSRTIGFFGLVTGLPSSGAGLAMNGATINLAWANSGNKIGKI